MTDYRLKDRDALQDDDNDLVEAVVEPIWDHPSADPGTGDFPAAWTGVTQGQRWVYALVWLERECSNGGLAQYFWNWAGVFHDVLRQATKAMGLAALDEVYHDAAKFFDGGKPPRSSDGCRAVMSQKAQALARTDPDYEDDDEIMVLNDLSILKDLNERVDVLLSEDETFYSPIAAYIRSHTDEFFV